MKAATATAAHRVPAGRAGLWLEFYRALARRNFVRAVETGRALGLDEQRLRPIQHDALRQFLAEYQNFDGAARLCADYCLTAEELSALAADLIARKKLDAQTTFSQRTGRHAYLSVAAQIRAFVARQAPALRGRAGRSAGAAWWKKMTSKVRSWLDRLSGQWRGGGFPQGGLAWR
jgi:hypothetical protein